jgi:hypothetical protein
MYGGNQAKFLFNDGKEHYCAISANVLKEFQGCGFLLPPDNHPDVWLEFSVDDNGFIRPGAKVTARPEWATDLFDPTKGEVKSTFKSGKEILQENLNQKKAELPNDPPKHPSGSSNPTILPSGTETAQKPAPAPEHPTVPPKDEWNEEREEFCNLLTASGREGMPDLLQHLIEKTDFFIAPSSTKYHDARDGGLLHHSMKVYHNLVELMKIYEIEIPTDGTSLAIIALLHDICKTDIYKKERKSLPRRDEKTGELVLDDWGKKIWDEQIIFTIDDQYPLGHGEKSVIMIQRFIQLTDTEIFAIRWHMMAYDDSRNSYAGNLAITNASDKFRIIPLFHMADLAASFLEIKPDQKINEVTKDA